MAHWTVKEGCWDKVVWWKSRVKRGIGGAVLEGGGVWSEVGQMEGWSRGTGMVMM